jgi:hypothetical protein
MDPTAFQVHKWWFTRAAVVLVITVLAVGATAYLIERPILWCTLIGSSLPLTMCVFVAWPLLHRESHKS